MDVQTKSLYGNIYDQAFYNGAFFDKIYPMAIKLYDGVIFKTFSTKHGVPERLTVVISNYQNEPGFRVHEERPKEQNPIRKNRTRISKPEPNKGSN